MQGKVKIKELFFKYMFLFCAVFGVLAIIVIIFYLLMEGVPGIAEIGFFKFIFGSVWRPDHSTNPQYGILPMIVGSLYLTALTIIIGVPLGVFAAIFLSRYCKGKLYNVLKQIITLIAGIPSVIFGYFGVQVLKPLIAMLPGATNQGLGLVTSSITLAIMMLPTIILVSLDSLNSVPKSYYEGALALGATHTQAVFKTVVPAAKSGIFASVILGINRAIGETMALTYVTGNIAEFPGSLFQSFRTLTVNIVVEMKYAEAGSLHWRAIIASGVVLFVFSLLIIISFNAYSSRSKERELSKKKRIKLASVKEIELTPPSKQKNMNRLVPLCYAAITISVLAIVFIVGYVFVRGIPYINIPFLTGKGSLFDPISVLPSLVRTLMVIGLTVVIAVPLGVGASLFLNEYTKKGSKLVRVIRVSVEALAGIPSIIYGLFGVMFFVEVLGLGRSLYAGAFTMVLMILPVIIRTTEESLKSVPDSYREGSLALGASKSRTIFKVVLPSALSGVVTGLILGVGRIIGESAPLLYTSGTQIYHMPENYGSIGSTLTVCFYMLSTEGLYQNEAFAVGVVLILTVIAINLLAAATERFFARRLKNAAV